MSRRDEHLDDVLCHCGGGDDGHPLSAPECTATVKAGTYNNTGLDHSFNRSTGARRNARAVAQIYAELARVVTDPQRKARYRRSAEISRLARDVHARYVGP